MDSIKNQCTFGLKCVAITHPEVIKFLVDKEDGYKYSHGSEKKVKIKCPDCGYEAERMVIDLCNSGFNCPQCGDKISYPNKFIRAFLEQLPIQNLKYEYRDNWTQGKIYDNYFEYNEEKYLVEVDGSQHDKDTQWSTFEYQQENDDLKTKLAKDNNYHLIRLSCGRSRNYKLEEMLKESEFNKIFDLSNINWQLCREKAITNRYIEICNYIKENPNTPIYKVAEYFKINRETVTTALKRGSELGIIDYDANKRRLQMSIASRYANAIPIEVFDEDKNLIGSYPSLPLCLKDLNERFPGNNFNKTQYYKKLNKTEELKILYKNFYFRRMS